MGNFGCDLHDDRIVARISLRRFERRIFLGEVLYGFSVQSWRGWFLEGYGGGVGGGLAS